MTDEEIDKLMETDPIKALCALVKEAGLTMRLYGVSVTEEQLKAQATASAVERIELAVCSSLKDQMTDAEKLKLLIERVESAVRYTLGTLPYESLAVSKSGVKCDNQDYVAIHGGRAVSSTRQLTQLMKLVEELKNG